DQLGQRAHLLRRKLGQIRLDLNWGKPCRHLLQLLKAGERQRRRVKGCRRQKQGNTRHRRRNDKVLHARVLAQRGLAVTTSLATILSVSSSRQSFSTVLSSTLVSKGFLIKAAMPGATVIPADTTTTGIDA